MAIFHKLVGFFRVFMKCLNNTLVKIPHCSCKTKPILPCRKQVHGNVSLNDNELLLTPPLSASFCVFGDVSPSKTSCIYSGSHVGRK